MRVVVVDEKQAERQAVVRALTAGSHLVDAAADAKSAVLAVQRAPTQVIVVGWPASGGAELLRLLRSADASGHAYILTIIDPLQPGRDLGAALSAGAQDILRRPIFDEELLARVQGPCRLIAWARAVTQASTFDWSSRVDLSALRAWKSMGQVVAGDLAQILGELLQPVDGWPNGFDKGLRAATIPMSLATEQTELRISVIADAPTLTLLGESLLGDPKADRSAMDDLMRELANTAGGAIKRAALPDSVTLTTGIPISEAGARPRGETTTRCWTIPVAAGVGTLVLVGEIRNRENLRVPASQLREGMVLVHDLRNDAGALLVTAGTRLTSTTAERVGQLLGHRFVIEVACAA